MILQDFPPRRAVAGHKGSFGHLAIIAGSFGFHGAAVLAARGAQRAQPGLVTLYHAGIHLSRGRVAIAGGDGECLETGNQTARIGQRRIDRAGVWRRRSLPKN